MLVIYIRIRNWATITGRHYIQSVLGAVENFLSILQRIDLQRMYQSDGQKSVISAIVIIFIYISYVRMI